MTVQLEQDGQTIAMFVNNTTAQITELDYNFLDFTGDYVIYGRKV